MTEEKKLRVVGITEAEDEIKQRDSKVFELRIQGFTFEQIAAKVGFSGPSGAWQAYQRIRSEFIFESVEEARQLELMRLDEMQFAVWDRAINGDLPALSCVLKIMDRRAKLLGLDKPEKMEVDRWDYNGADLDQEVKRIVDMMNEREDQFMARREAQVRAEMRVQFEIEKRLEKELQSETNIEDMKASILAFLGDVNEPE